MHNRLINAGNALVGRVPARVRWSIADQVLVSGGNALTGIILVRALGLHGFGIYSLVWLGVQLLAIPQTASIVAPMMSLFDQRGTISRHAYLAAVLLHQLVYAACVAVLIDIVAFAFGVETHVHPALIIAVCIATQLQDLARRFLFVTERPEHAFVSDLIAYGVRLAILMALAWTGTLTDTLVWVVIVAVSIAALLPIVPDLLRLEFDRDAIARVTQSHGKSAGWMIGTNLANWVAETSFLFMIVGTILGPAQLGAARAVQTIVLVTNLLLQSLENFAPSAASKALVGGGEGALLSYTWRLAWLGVALLTATTAFLLVFADPIMMLAYGRTFPDQYALIAIFGAFQILIHVTQVCFYGLRATNAMKSAFFYQATLALVAIVVVSSAVEQLGLIGALLILLALKLALAVALALLLRATVRARAAA